MFFLSFDIATHLRNLRLTHREGAVSFLPGKTGAPVERTRDPTRRIRLQFTDKFRERLVLPQFRQDVNVIGRSIHDDRNSFFPANCPAEVLMNSRTDCRSHPWLAILGRKDNVIEQVAMGGTHAEGPFRRPSSGAFSFLYSTAGVPLRSTPGFIPPHPRGALSITTTSCSSSRAEFNQLRTRDEIEPYILPQRPASIVTASGSPRRPKCRLRRMREGVRSHILPRPWPGLLVTIRCSSLRAKFETSVQRRRRDGVKPGVKRSETPGRHGINIVEPLARGDGNRVRIERAALQVD